ncbi:putative IGF-like family receptor 1 [Scophthalmus maximus]|uniref:Putative IGF-like family receptor 1 n=1 Tax=Scophthalmus maximus TaxID=52904 RepID=A0A2U9AYZ0_SCOMX|nr:IGF-like family receptor 1 isoform X2 [Scophthalmus maximus]AWO96795.1 putative IGF-like family receptor 1 [Scophthalmus maximus]
MSHSVKCPDATTRYDMYRDQCVPCPFKPGHGVSPNCGYDDDGGLHEPHHSPCGEGQFNDGSTARCRPCSACPPGSHVVWSCTSVTDTRCQEPTIPTNTGSNLIPHATDSGQIAISSVLLWAVPLAILICILVALSAFIIYRKRNRGRGAVLSFSKRSSLVKDGFSPLSAPACNNDLEDILSPDILSAPLQTVLDNLDVLEELVILLDPDNQIVKSTKHLASLCSFPSTWITYTYSMKDSKSPLKAVLEGVTSRHPDWTVANFAKLLRQMERNDAIAVLARLGLNEIAM